MISGRIHGEEGDKFWDSSRNVFWHYTSGRWVKADKSEDTDKIRKLANDIDFYRSTADGSPEMIRAVALELFVLISGLIDTDES